MDQRVSLLKVMVPWEIVLVLLVLLVPSVIVAVGFVFLEYVASCDVVLVLLFMVGVVVFHVF